MKYCMNCGAGLEDDAVFCSQCGSKQENISVPADGSIQVSGVENTSEGTVTPEESAFEDANPEQKVRVTGDASVSGQDVNAFEENSACEQPADVTAETTSSEYGEGTPGKPFFKSVPGIIVIIIGFLVIAGGIVLACIMNSPKVMLARAVNNTAADIEQIPVLKFMGEVAENGSVSATADIGELLGSAGLDMDAEITLKEYNDSDNSSAAITADIKLLGSSAVDASMWKTPEALILQSDVLLGKKAYGIGLNTLKDNLPDSFIGEKIPDELYEALDESDRRIFEQSEECSKIMIGYITDVSGYMGDQLVRNAEIKKTRDNVDFNKSIVKTTVITMSVDDKALRDIITDTVRYAEEEEKFSEAREIIKSYMEYIALSSGEYDIDSEEQLKDVFDSIKEAVNSIDALDLEFRFYIYRSRLVKIEAEEYESGIELSFVLGPDPADPELIEISSGDGESDISIGWKAETNTPDEYKAELYLKKNDEENCIDLAWDRKNGDFSVKMNDGDSISGIMTESGDDLTIEIDRLEFDGENTGMRISILFKKKDIIPETPEFEEILTMSEDELEDIIEDMKESLTDIVFGW